MRKVVIIGAGPAGLTAAHEILEHSSDIKPIIIEEAPQPGGLSKTVLYKGNRMDIGGHRFFSKSDKVMKWWQNVLPPAGFPARDDLKVGRYVPLFSNGPDPEKEDKVMLIRHRLSRILYERKFYPYPLSFDPQVVTNLGFCRTFLMGYGYLMASLKQIRPELTLEDFLVNRFGRPLYEMFFRDYTKKVWGKGCEEIEASWGHQRVKGLSMKKVLLQLAKPTDRNLLQKEVETTLINYFLYPKYGPGQLWEEVGRKVRDKGGVVVFSSRAERIFWEGKQVKAVETKDLTNGKPERISADYLISSMPIKDLILGLFPPAPDAVRTVARELPYRDFVTVGILLDDANLPQLKDNWIYVQEKDVKLGRIQIFNNWSPYMVDRNDLLWIGLEYFCQENDEIWNLTDENMKGFVISELLRLGFIQKKSWVRDAYVVRVRKTYPAYWGGYKKFHIIREFTDELENLFLIGRNGMHCYNNQDHSMLTAMEAVKNIVDGKKEKDNIWQINTQAEYHEEGSLKPQ
jgi:protoporphyrinogen oxidase